MKKTFSRCASLSLAALALFLAPSARSQQTPVLFPLVNLTGTANNRTIYITPDAAQNPLWYGTNLVSLLPFPIYPIGGQVITNLTPWGYTFRVDGWPRGIHVVVPFSTNTLNIVSLINTNQFAPLQILALANNATGTNVNLQGIFNGVDPSHALFNASAFDANGAAAAAQAAANAQATNAAKGVLASNGLSYTAITTTVGVSGNLSISSGNLLTGQLPFELSYSGTSALYFDNAGNIGLGYQSSGVTGTGIYGNIGIGELSLYNCFISAPALNTAVGYGAESNAITAQCNSAFGANALAKLYSGSNNIAIGNNAGLNYTANETGNIDIGNLGILGENNITRIGAGQSDAYIAGTVHASLALTVGSGIITNGGAVWLFYRTNGLMGTTLTNLPWGTICTTTNGQFEVLSNMVWLLK